MNFELQLFGKTIGVVCSDAELQATLSCYLGPACSEISGAGPSAFATFALTNSGVTQLSGPLVDFSHAKEPFAQLELAIVRLVERMGLAGTLIHAGCVQLGGLVIVVTAPSGGGKTTFTRELLRRGATYVTDDLLQVDEGRLRGLARALHFDPIDPNESCPEYWLDTDRVSYELTLNGRRMVVPVWWRNNPVALELAFQRGDVVVVTLRRGEDRVRALTSLERAVVLHEAAIVAHGEYDGGLGPGPTYEVAWNEPSHALEMLLRELGMSSGA